VGAGVEGSLGVYVNFTDETITLFYEVGGGAEVNSVVSAGGGVQLSYYWNDAQFWGWGGEIGLNLPFGGGALEFGDDGVPAGVSVGAGPSFGVDVHAFGTGTRPIGSPYHFGSGCPH
jgi:hypothetical protein